jgi:hypothetical protein
VTEYNLPDQTKGGTPCAPIEYIEKNYPELYNQLMIVQQKGERYYDDGEYKWGITTSDRWGTTVYQNERSTKGGQQVSKFAYSAPSKAKQTTSAQGQQSFTDKENEEIKNEAKKRFDDLIAALRSLTALLIYDVAKRYGVTYEELVKQIRSEVVDGKNLQDIL